MTDAPPEPGPFSRARRRLLRDRAAARWAAHAVIPDHIAGELLERLDAVKRSFTRALLLGWSPVLAAGLAARGIATVTVEPGARLARAAGGIQGDEDRLPIADGAVDLVMSAGGLESVGDLPGALILARRALRPDGLLLAGFAGAGSLPRLKATMLAADAANGGGAAARVHPQVDVRTAGNLLSRAGFALPVADGDRLELRYRSLQSLLDDLRFSGLGGALSDRPPPLGRRGLVAAHAAFADAAEPDGRTTEVFELVFLTGWAPDPSQPRPARPGSGTASLTAALRATRD